MDETTDVSLDALDEEIDRAQAAGDDKTARLLKATREENARRRIANRDLRARLEQIEADYKALEGKASSSDERFTQLQNDLDQERQRWQSRVERDEAANKLAIERLPERLRSVVPNGLSPAELRDWLDVAVPTLTGNQPVPLEGQAGSVADRGDGDVVPVTNEVAAFAKSLGIDPQLLAKEVKKDGNKRI